MMTKQEVESAVKAAMAAPFQPVQSCGCGRAYVVVCGERAEINAVSAVCKKLGLLFQRRSYGVGGPAVYMGYDNADGLAMGKAIKFAEVLSGLGLKAYADGVSD